MTITLTREEAQQVLEHLDDLVDFQQWDIDMHVTQYGEEYKPHRMKHMKEQLANTNSTIETLRARLAQPEPERPLKLGDMEQRAFDQECEFLSAAQPEPEPVADKYLMEVECTKCGAKQDGVLTVTAPPQRKWQGLTNDEREKATGWSVEHIEAKLKEKNTS